MRHDSAATMAEPDDGTAGDASPVGRARAGRGRRARWPVALVLAWAMLAVADVAVFHSAIFRSGPDSGHTAAEAAAAPGAAAHRHATRSHPPPARARASRRPGARARVLAPVSASAFGPTGPGSGDNPQNTSLAIDASTTTAWITHWYRTARFGGLQAGTGLLIDMGHPVRITRVQIVLGSTRGADLELLTGNAPSLADQRLQASASDAAGTLRLKLARPERARYLLVWFTLLPPDSTGTFQASVYNIKIVGRR